MAHFLSLCFLPMRTPLLVLFSTILPGLVHANAPDGRPVRNSFVNRRVRTVPDLLAHLRTDGIVADRYERHFSMDRPTVLRFLAGLHCGRLTKAGVYTIYSVPKSGRLKMHVGRLPKGEPMFFDRAGRPTLVMRCGNPVTLGPQRKRLASRRLGLSEPEGTRAITPAQSLATGLLDLVPETLKTTVATSTAIAAPPMVESIATVGASGADSGFSWFGALSFLPALGSPSPSHPASLQGPFAPKQPVPEPASLVALAGGLLAACRRRRSA